MKVKSLDHDYLSLMRPHPYGRALYKPPTVTHFHPGSVGYFNADLDWTPITDLSDAKTSSSPSWPTTAFTPPPPPEQLQSAPVETQTWGPKLGQDTKCRAVELSESISLTAFTGGVPLAAGTCFRFETGSSAGAVLLTNGPVTHRRYFHEAPFKKWVAENAKAILHERPEVAEYGLWVVTSTWTASEAALNCWSSERRAVDVGFNVQVVEIGELAPKGQWKHAGSADGWIHFKEAGTDEKAVFFGGLYFTWRKIIRSVKHEKDPKRLRGGRHDSEQESISTFSNGDLEEDQFEVLCQPIFEDESLRPVTQDTANDESEEDEDW
ncbi:hypothetical protein NLU13_0153 [Sarocladium strictum]|uniref:Uncharacterized protein n=1 Tax=Sarocladium strictum TaxID=5046 RepID=A0AA39LB89_SARSR|nr:hypothetical protein NLU13_0153 [Sarocladium strictum]